VDLATEAVIDPQVAGAVNGEEPVGVGESSGVNAYR
jgi:hypothetical protein